MVFAIFQSGNSLLLLLLCSIIIIVKSSKFKGSFAVEGGEALFANPMTFLGQMLTSAPLVSKEVIDERECLLECAKDSQCRSTNFQTVPVSSGKFVCQILDTNKFLSPELVSGSMDYHHHSFSAPCELNPCMNGATCLPIKSQYDFKCACAPGYYGKLCNVSYESCAELLKAGFKKSGIHLIEPFQTDMFNVSCDQTSNGGGISALVLNCLTVNSTPGWTMVFKAISNVSSAILQPLWTSADTLNEENTDVLSPGSFPREHYKNRFIQNWQTADPKEVRVSIFEGQNEVFSIVFNATNSDNTNWFSASRVISSPWTDFITNPPAYFTLNVPSDRPFLIALPYIGCELDGGWLVVSSGPCAWDKRFPAPSILYSKLKTSTNWNVPENVGCADVLIVYIR